MLRKNKITLCLSSIVLVILFTSCSSSKKNEDKGVTVPQVFVGPIKMRRPEQPSIKPNETPGSDRFSRPQEADDKNLECHSVELKKEKIKLIFECLKSLKEPLQITLKLLRHTEPEWILQVNDETPDCLVQELSYLPVPREVFFLANHESTLTCINARLDVEKDESFDSIWNETETKMNVVLGVDQLPKSEDETARTVKAWILSPFFGKDRSLHGKSVPKKMCQACFQNEKIFQTQTQELPLWP